MVLGRDVWNSVPATVPASAPRRSDQGMYGAVPALGMTLWLLVYSAGE
jgi:hypothetical protein